jgi:hypothetical protein
MNLHWILDADLREVECPDVMTWANWYETAERHVGEDRICGYRISTVFLGLDHNWWPGARPLLYETMIFKIDPEATFGQATIKMVERYATWIEAEEGHEKTVAIVTRWLRQRGELATDEEPVRYVPIPARVSGPGDGGPDPGEGVDPGEPDLS